jgi:molecular chaperone GrpE
VVTRVEDKDNTMNELNQDSIAEENELDKKNIDSEDIEETSECSDDENFEDGMEASSEGDVKKSFFKKDKKEKKDKKDIKIDELNDRLIRTMAEFDNFRKRSEKEKSQMFDIGARDIIEKVLPVIDNFERGLGTITEEEKENAFAQGIEKIYKQLVTSLGEAGLKAIDAVGREFDPNFHNAVMHAEDSELGENIVAEEFQKGYMYKDTVVRHSMVKVVN